MTKNPVEIAAKITSKTACVNGPSGKCMTLSLVTFLHIYVHLGYAEHQCICVCRETTEGHP